MRYEIELSGDRIDVAFVPIDCLSIPVSSFDSFLLKREFSGEFLCLGVCAPPALEYNILSITTRG